MILLFLNKKYLINLFRNKFSDRMDSFQVATEAGLKIWINWHSLIWIGGASDTYNFGRPGLDNSWIGWIFTWLFCSLSLMEWFFKSSIYYIWWSVTCEHKNKICIRYWLVCTRIYKKPINSKKNYYIFIS